MPPRAEKEAVAIILDIGKSMQKRSAINRESTVFQEAKRCVIKILGQKIISESPNEYILILFGSDETKNGLKQEGNSRYENIFVYRNLCRPTFQLLEYIENTNATENEANIADALLVGAEELHRGAAGQKFVAHKIVFFTNFGGRMVVNDVNSVIKKAIAQTFHLIFVCDLNLQKTEKDSEFTNELRQAQHCFEAIENDPNCGLFSFEEAKELFANVKTKPVTSAPWFANLYLGSLFKIPIVGYIKTTQSKLKTWTKSRKDENLGEQESNEGDRSNECDTKEPNVNRSQPERVTSQKVYYVGEKKEVDQEDVIRAYTYGSTILPVTEDDEKAMEYHSERKGFEILFFTSQQNIKVHYKCGDKTMIVALSHNSKGAKSTAEFHALARALYETDCVAIVRYCRLEKFTSQLGYLAPIIDSEKVVFTYIRLPFAEDMRYFNFPSFSKAPEDIPTSEQLALIDDLITNMDLSTADIDEDGGDCEALRCEDVPDPNIDVKFQLILSKCLKSYKPENVDPFVFKNEFYEKENILSQIKKKFVLEEVVDEKRRLSLDAETPVQMDVKKAKVENDKESDIVLEESKLAESFINLINAGHSWAGVTTKLEEVILKLSANLMGFNNAKIVDALAAYRRSAIAKENIQEYNTFLHLLKEKTKGRLIWKTILQRKLTLITKLESESSQVSIDEAKNFET